MTLEDLLDTGQILNNPPDKTRDRGTHLVSYGKERMNALPFEERENGRSADFHEGRSIWFLINNLRAHRPWSRGRARSSMK